MFYKNKRLNIGCRRYNAPQRVRLARKNSASVLFSDPQLHLVHRALGFPASYRCMASFPVHSSFDNSLSNQSPLLNCFAPLTRGPLTH